jgi:hypothetical protein
MNLQEHIRRILREDKELNPNKRVYDYDKERDTVPERLPFDIDKLVNSGVVFVTPAIDGDPDSKTYKEWLEEPYTHLISLYNVEHSSEDGWIKKAITKVAPTEQYKNFVNKIYDGKYNQILWGLEKLGINPMDMLIDTNIQENIRRVLREDTEIKSNYQKVIDKFKKILPKEYSEKIDEVFEYIKDFINKKGFNLKVLNNCQVPFKGTRTKDFIIICSPELYSSLPDLIYIIFHEIRHEIQMGELKQINPLSGDLENFDELYDIYWKMEMDAHDYGIEWVDKIGNMINLPKEYYKLSPMVTSYPSMGHMVRDQIVVINKTIQELKKNGHDYSDISDLPFVKKHLDKLENLF